MDYQKFIQQLPNLYENWGQNSVNPKSEQFRQVLAQVQGMTTVNILQLLNFAVACMEANEVYCEVGTSQGATLIGALLEHERMAYAVDEPTGENLAILTYNLAKFGLEEQVGVCTQNFEQFFSDLREIDTDDKIGVYFYNGSHDYRSQLLGLLLVRPFLSNQALIVVNNSNWGTVQQSVWDFIATTPECQVLLEIAPLIAFGNGIFILSWDVDKNYNYSWDTFSQKRQQPLIQEIYNLQIPYLIESGNNFYHLGRYPEAIHQYRKVVQLQSGDANLYDNLSQCYKRLGRTEESIATLQEGIRHYPTEGRFHFFLIMNFQQNGRIQEAISAAETAFTLLPNDYTFKILKNLLVPIIYNTPDEINFYKQRFKQGLQALIEQTSLETVEDRASTLIGIGNITNFYLAYQAYNVIDEQVQYGNLVHKIMAANYPQWAETLSMPPRTTNNKIRVGYTSNYLHSYSGTLWLVGWLRQHDKQQFEVYCYYTGNDPDLITQQFQAYSDVFYHIPGNLEAVCQQIISDRLHILVYPEIGMDAPTIRLAGLRLAPVQCTAWGHPVTTGLPTIDYFLSNELMEPADAQEHYSEKLICFPNIGVAYPKPKDIPPISKKRSDYHLPEDAVVYFCCQAPFKYLPQFDYIFAEIARRVPKAKFVFLRGKLLKPRLHRAFAAVGLNSEDYCVFLTIPERVDYLMLNLLSDVFLDTFTWSGGNTGLEAIACNLPIVTLPGEFMRGRHCYGFLRMLGVTDTIAQTEAEYIEIATKLGLDPDWRRNIVERIKVRHDNLFDDATCVEALEAFYQQVVADFRF